MSLNGEEIDKQTNSNNNNNNKSKKPHLKDIKTANSISQETISPSKKSFRSLSEVILNKIVISPTVSIEHSFGSSLEQNQSTSSFDKYKQIKLQQINTLKQHQNHEKYLQQRHYFHHHDSNSTNDQQDFLKKFSTRSFNQTETLRRPSFMPHQISDESNHANELDETTNAKLKSTKFYLPAEPSLNCKSMSADNSSSNLSNLNNQDTVETHDFKDFNNSKKSKIIENILIRLNFFVISPDDNGLFVWLCILNLCFLYNIWLIIARQSFEKLQTNYSFYWKIFDSISDVVYLIDICVQFRTGYLEQGLLVYNSKKLALNYMKSKKFLLDLFSLTPLELLQLKYGYDIPMLRFPRFFKGYRFAQLCYIAESRTLYPNLLRVIFLTHILFLLGHWFAGFYFLISQAEGFKGHWSYPEPIDEFALLPRMYLRCLYWSTLTLTTIGDLPPPETNWQWLRDMSNSRYMFSIAVHYLAVFVIALIVGQVGNVIANRNASRVEFERLLDGAKQYMRNHNVPTDMQKRVQRWYDYSWSRGRMTGAGDFHSIGLLPDKLKTELALHVNLETLRKVTIFQECQPEFLHDLVLKMRAYIFTPGDFICRKGEIAREMFIIADGVLEVLGDKGQVFTKMYSGDFFGEIGILNIEGASNKRTADVRSVGYAELFSLSKDDILSAVRDYPEAERILIEYGRRRLNKNSQPKIEQCLSVEEVKPLNESSVINTFTKKEIIKEATIHEEETKFNRTQSKKLKDISKLKELNTISEEINQRVASSLTTDMLGIPTTNNSNIKYQTNDELLGDYFANTSQDFNTFYKNHLQKILNNLNSSSNDFIKELLTKDLIELKETLEKEKISRVDYLEEIIVQKDAKIKQLESKIKMLHAFITQKKFENV